MRTYTLYNSTIQKISAPCNLCLSTGIYQYKHHRHSFKNRRILSSVKDEFKFKLIFILKLQYELGFRFKLCRCERILCFSVGLISRIVDFFYIQVRDETKSHLKSWPQFPDNRFNVSLHRVTDKHVFYVITDM